MSLTKTTKLVITAAVVHIYLSLSSLFGLHRLISGKKKRQIVDSVKLNKFHFYLYFTFYNQSFHKAALEFGSELLVSKPRVTKAGKNLRRNQDSRGTHPPLVDVERKRVSMEIINKRRPSCTNLITV